MTEKRKITVLNPQPARRKLKANEPPPGFPPGMTANFQFEPTSVKLAKRLATMEDKTIYLVDIGFGGGYAFMQEIQHWFTEHMPSVTTILKRKPGHVFGDNDNSLWEEIKNKCDGVILGVAG
jgi:hypothetical protein